jgi:hypothetical protein
MKLNPKILFEKFLPYEKKQVAATSIGRDNVNESCLGKNLPEEFYLIEVT